jgi:hypothetical protein
MSIAVSSRREAMPWLIYRSHSRSTVDQRREERWTSTEVSFIRNISVKMPHGFAYAIEARLHTLFLAGHQESIWPLDERQEMDEEWKISSRAG